jgi:hypothetical protein
MLPEFDASALGLLPRREVDEIFYMVKELLAVLESRRALRAERDRRTKTASAEGEQVQNGNLTKTD